jgi:hypothetical protein
VDIWRIVLIATITGISSAQAEVRRCDINAVLELVDALCDPQGVAETDFDTLVDVNVCKKSYRNAISIRLLRSSRLTGQGYLAQALKLGYGLSDPETLGVSMTHYLRAGRYIQSDDYIAAVLEYHMFDYIYIGCGRNGTCFRNVIESIDAEERHRVLRGGLFCDFSEQTPPQDAIYIYELKDYPLCRQLYCMTNNCDQKTEGNVPFILSAHWDEVLRERYGELK